MRGSVRGHVYEASSYFGDVAARPRGALLLRSASSERTNPITPKGGSGLIAADTVVAWLTKHGS